ncbi:Thiol:disulfide interchange protein DsbD [Caloramator mitchellensis]|uniref:Thiol:disulfide interchange protein DsbD n=1 Tax=Caloramator mitchellensis TaxID=908809 RepID=A0A0R3JS97_CALMK|nr:cytochrome c biogenesis CcdA family protein [Caloramator mitchellensis]KRQ86344.1 Thiol:disulfide interchange protein DsbD [Caloramator mitchellensis]
MKDITFGIVFLEGVASFLSPCFLPLIPVYLAYLSGEAKDKRLVKNSISFILGFTLIFVLLGATASGVGKFLLAYRDLFDKVLGVVIIIMGLFYLDIIKSNFLMMERKVNIETQNQGFLKGFLLGVGLAFGWTPCIGPILASVLAIAASKSSMIFGIILLFIYSMGIAVPFIIMAYLIQRFNIKTNVLMKKAKIVKLITGVIMILTGIMLFTGYFERLSSYLWRL